MLPKWLMNRPKKLVSHVVARISQAQSISDTWISIAAIRNSKSNNFFVKGPSNGAEYLVIINDEGRTFKNDIDNNAYYTYSLHSCNKNLPCCQCIDLRRSQLPCKHMIAVFQKHSLTWENLPRYYKSSLLFIINDDLILPQKHIHSVEDTQILEGTNENMNQGMSDDSNKSRVLVDLPKINTPKRTTATVCLELLNEIKSLMYMIYDPDVLLTLKQQLDINESCRKVAPSYEGLFIQRRATLFASV